MAQVIKDFILQLGFDGSQVEKGLKAIGVQMDGLAVKQERQAKKSEQIAIRRNRVLTSLKIAERRAMAKLGDSDSPKVQRSLQRLTAQMERFKQAAMGATSSADFSKITNGIRLTNQQLDFTIQKSNAVARSFKAQKFAANAARDSARNMARSYLSVFAAVGAAGSAGRTGIGFESVRASMLAASGSTQQVEKDFQFVKDTAMLLGRDIRTSAKGFQQIAVSAKDAGLSLDQAKEMFLAGSEASTAFGLSAEDTFGVFRAFTQIISKGTVSSEELKQQLGDRLPIAMSTAAKATGVTVQELTKMLENGELIATDFLPKFSKQLRIAARNGGALNAALQTSGVALQRLKSSFDLNVDQAFTAGFGSGFTSFLENMRATVDNMAPTFRTFGRVVGGALNAFGVTLRAVSQLLRPVAFGLDQISQAFSEAATVTEDTERSLSGLATILRPIIGLFKLLGAALLLPFAVLEMGMDKLESMEDGWVKSLLGIAGGFLAIASALKLIKSFSGVFGMMKGFLGGGDSGKGGKGGKGGLMSSKAGGIMKFLGPLALAFGVGGAAGGVINDHLIPDNDTTRSVGDSFGRFIDRSKSFFGDSEAAKRLHAQGERTLTMNPPQGVVNNQTQININAGSASATEIAQAVEERLQGEYSTTMTEN